MTRIRWGAMVSVVVLAASSPAQAAPTVVEVVGAVQVMEKGVASGVGTTAARVQWGEPLSANVTRNQDYNSTYKWVFSAPDWRQEESRCYGSTEPGSTTIAGYLNGQTTIYDPSGLPKPIAVVYSPAHKDKTAAVPWFAQYVGCSYLLVDDTPSVSKEMLAALGLQVVQEENVNGVATVLVAGTSPSGKSLKWWLGPSLGYRPVKYETSWQLTGVTGYKETGVIRSYESFIEVAPSIWLPTRTSVVQTITKDDGTVVTQATVTATTTYETVNVAIDPSRLTIVPPAGAEVVYKE